MPNAFKSLLIVAAFTSLGGCVSLPRFFYNQPGNSPLTVTLKDGSHLRYMEYVPPGAPKGQKMPLIVFLHGSGEAGRDTYALLANGPWDYAVTHPKFPFIIVAPQLDRDGEWSPDQLNEWFSKIEKDLPIDRRRIYLTGLSRGGQGTWDFAMRYPHYFAAIAPVSAYSDVKMPCRLKGIPVWAFHGADDPTVPIGQDQAVVDAARACGISVQFTIYPHTGHDAWSQTYENPKLYDWFLTFTKPRFRMPPPPAPVVPMSGPVPANLP